MVCRFGFSGMIASTMIFTLGCGAPGTVEPGRHLDAPSNRQRLACGVVEQIVSFAAEADEPDEY